MSASLKPCPFCGGEAVVNPCDHDTRPEPWSADCKAPFTACPVVSRAFGNTEDEAIERWNRRSDPSREAMREALEAVLRFAERNHCTHEETRRLGAIWTECTWCGRKWADDDGGMPEYREPDEFIAARAALALDGDAK